MRLESIFFFASPLAKPKMHFMDRENHQISLNLLGLTCIVPNLGFWTLRAPGVNLFSTPDAPAQLDISFP